MDTKGTLYEQGVRIPQFIHYPDEIPPGTKFDAPVSVLDIGATMFDFAEIIPEYELDGESWRHVIKGGEDHHTSLQYWEKERCLFFESERDRGVRCGCDKYLEIQESSTTYGRGLRKGFSVDPVNLFYLCDDDSMEYVTNKRKNMEKTGLNLNLRDTDKVGSASCRRIQMVRFGILF